MNFVSWNCRGTGAKGFTSLIKDIRRHYDASLMFLMETHSSGQRAKQQANRTGLLGNFIVDSRGQAGGIWCIWDTSSWKVDIIESSDQFVHTRVTWKGSIKWLITAVYASPNYIRRNQLWGDLTRISEAVNEPWVVLGDFNTICGPHERKGGSSNFSIRGSINFRNIIHDCDLIDVGFQGNHFTWKHGNHYQRLDRVMINIQWRLKFQEAAVFHLPFFKFDHRALLVQLRNKRPPNRRRRPFRFLASWRTHENFPNLMRRLWVRGAPWCQQVPKIHQALQKWNKDVFGNIFQRKRDLISQLEEIAHQLTSNPSDILEAKQRDVWRQYEQVLFQEEMLWYQKSRAKWLHFGDRNTRYFHGTTAVRRRRNTYDIL